MTMIGSQRAGRELRRAVLAAIEQRYRKRGYSHVGNVDT